MDPARTIYYLPGYGGSLSVGLGQALSRRGYDIAGRETVGEFRSLPFRQQVETVAEDLQRHFWHEGGRVLAVSYGAYLLLHALARLPPYGGSVLLLSPIVGEFSDSASGTNFSPPFSGRLQELAQAGELHAPSRCRIQVGSKDWQSDPDSVVSLGQLAGIAVTVVPGAGHQLGKEYVGPVLDEWLGTWGAAA